MPSEVEKEEPTEDELKTLFEEAFNEAVFGERDANGEPVIDHEKVKKAAKLIKGMLDAKKT